MRSGWREEAPESREGGDESAQNVTCARARSRCRHSR